MRDPRIERLIAELEHHIECWKQFNRFVALARSKQFSAEDETQFLDLKAVIVQQLEMILSRIPSGAPSREEVHHLMELVPSIRNLSECPEGVIRSIETRWHKVFVGWQSVLGQLKVKQAELESTSFFSSLMEKFTGKKDSK
jgi:hypothetical protein